MAPGDADSFIDKNEEKFHDNNSDSDSYSDSSDDNKKRPPVTAAKSNRTNAVYRLFGRDRPVHKVLGGGKRTLLLSLPHLRFFIFSATALINNNSSESRVLFLFEKLYIEILKCLCLIAF